jgi:hypothetical protein
MIGTDSSSFKANWNQEFTFMNKYKNLSLSIKNFIKIPGLSSTDKASNKAGLPPGSNEALGQGRSADHIRFEKEFHRYAQFFSKKR